MAAVLSNLQVYVATNPQIEESLHDAQILMSYGSASGIALDQATIKAIIETATQIKNGQITDEQETAFWQALINLSKAVYPVTISSLRATVDSYAPESAKLFSFNIGRRSKARWAVYRYTFGTAAMLFFLLVCQVYWLWGTWIVSDIQKVKVQLTAIDQEIRQARQGQTVVMPKPAVVAAAKDPPKPAAVKPPADQQSADLSLASLRTQRDNLLLQEEASYRLLTNWADYWDDAEMITKMCISPILGRAKICENIARYQAVLVVLESFQRYLLPLLYGLLGCCVYILRTLSNEIRLKVYSEASNIEFRIRLYLGMLGGIVVAWFITPEASEGLMKNLSPFALAFLAGYSIELVFSAMDRLISAFTNK